MGNDFDYNKIETSYTDYFDDTHHCVLMLLLSVVTGYQYVVIRERNTEVYRHEIGWSERDYSDRRKMLDVMYDYVDKVKMEQINSLELKLIGGHE